MSSNDSVSERLEEFARQRVDHVEAIRVDEVVGGVASGVTSGGQGQQRRLMLVGAAALVVLGAAGLGVAQSRSVDPGPASPANPTLPEVAGQSTDPVQTSDSLAPATSPVATPATLTEQVASLPPWDAAQLVWVDAQFRASPAELADLRIANELRSRACLEDNGIELPGFDVSRHEAFLAEAQQSWERRRSIWTVEGRELMSTIGYPAIWSTLPTVVELPIYPDLPTPTPPNCYPAATGVTFLGGGTVYSEDQILEKISDGASREFAPVNWAFGRLAGTESLDRKLTECMKQRGWAKWGEIGAPYQELTLADPPTGEALTLATDHASCIEQIDATGPFLEASAAYVKDFQRAFTTEISQIDTERRSALQEAYEELAKAGIDPLSN